MSLFQRNLRHRFYWKLSFWQLPVRLMTKISSTWWLFHFNGYVLGEYATYLNSIGGYRYETLKSSEYVSAKAPDSGQTQPSMSAPSVECLGGVSNWREARWGALPSVFRAERTGQCKRGVSTQTTGPLSLNHHSDLSHARAQVNRYLPRQRGPGFRKQRPYDNISRKCPRRIFHMSPNVLAEVLSWKILKRYKQIFWFQISQLRFDCFFVGWGWGCWWSDKLYSTHTLNNNINTT